MGNCTLKEIRMKRYRIICGLILLIAGFTVLSSPPALAQPQPQPIKTDLTLRLIPDIYYQQVNPAQDNLFYLEIRNNGSMPITDIQLSGKAPEKWAVELNPAQIVSLGAGSAQIINVNIRPVNTATTGDYTVTFFAQASETDTVISAMVRVENTASIWLWIGVAVAGLMIAGFIIIYRRFGG